MSLPDWVERARAKWRYRGQERPPFAAEPGPRRESVWDYPRPPFAAPDARDVTVSLGGILIARSLRTIRILETASPPTFYVPPEDIDFRYLKAVPGETSCEWKGAGCYWSVETPERRLERAAWSYPDPFPGYEEIRDYLSFYPAHLECRVAGVRVLPQPGQYYGGWVTPEIAGPFKGEPGSEQW